MSKFIFITGGVLSSLGKGSTAATIGTILENMGQRITFLKLDPYLNVDPGTMCPFQHGEVFVTQDGAETDLDLGHYERFTHATLHKHNSITSGKLYSRLLEKERRGDFEGNTIQIVPHLTDEIKQAINYASTDADCTIVEIGGTVGDIEGLPFLEAIRQMGLHNHRKNCLYIHLTYVPYVKAAQELKTKPTQHSVKELRSLGIQPDILICRSEVPLLQDIKKKIALFTNVQESAIVSAPDLAMIYELPLYLTHQEQLAKTIADHWGMNYQEPKLEVWQHIVSTIKTLQNSVTIAIVGKYIDSKDAYKSLYESLIHAQIPTKLKIHIKWVHAQELTSENCAEKLSGVDGIIIPSGFGNDSIEGKIIATRYAREQRIPFLGICLGMQVAIIEFARSVLKLDGAHSTEFDTQAKHPVVDLARKQKETHVKNSALYLGAQLCKLKDNGKAHTIYQQKQISERHRHRYEFNVNYIAQFENAGLLVSGVSASSATPQIIEIPDHPFFLACQFRPELQSKPYKPHPLFVALVESCRK